MRNPSRLTGPVALSGLLWIAAFLVVAVTFVRASNRAKSASVNAEYDYDLIGLPLMTAFRNGDRFGVHLEWGTLVLLIGPVLLGVLLISARLNRTRPGRTAVRRR